MFMLESEPYNKWETIRLNNERVGVVTNYLSTQFIESSFQVIDIPFVNYDRFIEENKIKTLFIDNEIFEHDHLWHKKDIQNLIDYCHLKSVQIILIKNTTRSILNDIKNVFIIEINPEIEAPKLINNRLNIPLLINEEIFNPLNSSQNNDFIKYYIGHYSSNLNLGIIDQSESINGIEFSNTKFTRKDFMKLIDLIKESKVIYLNKSSQLDIITMLFIEKIAFMQSCLCIFAPSYNMKSKYYNESIDSNDSQNLMLILINNPQYAEKLLVNIQREQLLNFSTLIYNGLKKILELNYNKRSPKISVITSTNRKDKILSFLKTLSNQKFVEIELNLVTHGFELDSNELSFLKDNSNFTINYQYANAEVSLGDALNLALDNTSFDIITKMDDDDYYYSHYLIDEYLALQYSKANIVGKSNAYYYFENLNILGIRDTKQSFRYVDFILGATIMGGKTTFDSLRFRDLAKSEDTDFLKRARLNDYKIYSTHPYDFCVYRSIKISNHTWQVSNRVLLKSLSIVALDTPENHVASDSISEI